MTGQLLGFLSLLSVIFSLYVAQHRIVTRWHRSQPPSNVYPISNVRVDGERRNA